MSPAKLIQALHEGADVTFQYKGINCGIFPHLEDDKMQYPVCYGDDDFPADTPEAAVAKSVFDGQSLAQICEYVTIDLQ